MATPSVPAGFKLVPDDNGQNQAPEARGKAAALSAFLARKGSPKQGKRLDRAVAKFETMWAQAPDALKEKYASRTKNDLAPSERGDLAPIPRPTNASLNATKPGETTGQAQERFRKSRAKNDPKPPVATPVEMASNPGRSQIIGKKDTVAIGTPEERARVAAMVNEGSDFATADNGDQGMKAAMAQQRADLMAKATANPPTSAQKSEPSPAPPSPNLPPSDNSTPIGRMWDQSIRDTKRQIGQVVDFVKKPFVSDVSSAQAEKATADSVAQQQAQTNAQTADREAEIARIKGAPAPTVGATQPPAAAPAAPYTGPMSAKPAAPVAGQPPIAGPAAVAQPTGAPVMATPKSTTGQPMDPAIKSDTGGGLTRVNRLTGLPFGFNPGDALPKSADGAMQQRGADSQTRQSQASATAAARPTTPPIAGPRPMQRGPASQPERTGSTLQTGAFSDAAYKGTEAAFAQGQNRQETLAKAQDVDDPAKFYKNPGTRVPLDQLVANQKIQGGPAQPPKGIPVGTRPVAPARRPMMAMR